MEVVPAAVAAAAATAAVATVKAANAAAVPVTTKVATAAAATATDVAEDPHNRTTDTPYRNTIFKSNLLFPSTSL